MSIAASDIIAAGKRVGIDAETLLALVAEIDAQRTAERRAGATERQRRKRSVTQNRVTCVTDVTCVTAPAPSSPASSSPPITPLTTTPPTNPTPLVSSEPSVSDPPDAKPKRSKPAYADDFEAFWRAYPTDRLMSKLETFRAWGRLSPEDRVAASAAVPAFRAHCAKDPTYRPIHACRFLSQRRFDGFASATGPQLVPTAPTVFVHADTPEWSEWATHLAALGKPPPKAIQMKAGFGGYFQSASPPPREGIRAA